MDLMTAGEYESSLPRVEKPDLLELVFDDVTDPSHERGWSNFYQTNPTLAREILKRSSTELQLAEGLTFAQKSEMNHAVISAVSFAISALEKAAQRINAEQAVIGDGVDGEAPPP